MNSSYCQHDLARLNISLCRVRTQHIVASQLCLLNLRMLNPFNPVSLQMASLGSLIFMRRGKGRKNLENMWE